MKVRRGTLPISFVPRRKPKPLKVNRSVQVTMEGTGVGLRKLNGHYVFYSGAKTKEAAKTWAGIASVGSRYDVKVIPSDKPRQGTPYLVYRRKK